MLEPLVGLLVIVVWYYLHRLAGYGASIDVQLGHLRGQTEWIRQASIGDKETLQRLRREDAVKFPK